MSRRQIKAFTRAFGHFIYFFFLLTIILILGAGLLIEIKESKPPLNWGTIFVIGVIIVAVGEYLLRKFKPAYYYKYGIPVFRYDFPALMPTNLQIKFEQLPTISKPKGFKPQINIQPLNNHEFGLWASGIESSRDRLFRRRRGRYNPLTHGYMTLDEEQNILKIRAYLNWFSLPFLVIWFGILAYSPGSQTIFTIGLITGGVVIFALLFVNEKKGYMQIGDAVYRYVSGEFDLAKLEETI